MRTIPFELARSALDAAPDALIIVDERGNVAFANRQVSAIFGYPHDELIGRPIDVLIPERFHARHLLHRSAYSGAPHLRPMGAGLDLYARRRDGSEFPVEISLSPIRGPGHELVAAAIRDVTDRRRVQAELIEARDAAQRADQAKSRFLAAASHDLRQPLQTLALLNRTLRSVVTEPDARDALAQQQHTINAMSRLINALLDIGKLESGAIKPQSTDFPVSRLFAELRQEFGALAIEKGLDLRVEDSGNHIHSDPSLIEEILRNLIANAIKYTRKGWVQLRCRTLEQSVQIEVLDTGIGIPPEHRSRIFDEFYQVDTLPHASREGYGLGLSIVQRIAALLNVSLEVRSEVGHGSVFSITVPAGVGNGTQTESFRASPLTARAAVTHRGRILLVEDEPSVRRATRLLLSVEGYEVDAVASLAEATAAARSADDIDLLMTDYHLRNGETGLAVISAVRERRGDALKVILMTGDTSSAVRGLPPDLNIRIISKPVDGDELLKLLDELLDRHAVG